MVVCSGCGDTYPLSARRARAARAAGARPLCPGCRRPPLEATAAQMAAYRAWWLERFTPDELRALATGIWPLLPEPAPDTGRDGPEL